MQKNCEVRILGAGTAGLSSAIFLAKKGFSPVVFEKAAHIGSRGHGDFQGVENFVFGEDFPDFLKRVGIRRNFFCAPVKKISIFAGNCGEMLLRSGEPVFYLVRRGPANSLDSGLFEQAIDAGAKINFNSAIPEKDCKIVASGAQNATLVSKGIVFETGAEDSVSIFFCDSAGGKGYGYLLISENTATLSTVSFAGSSNIAAVFRESLEKFKKEKGVEPKKPAAFAATGGGAFLEKNPVDSRFYIGEAGGFFDRLILLGVRYGLLSAFSAAEAIAAGENTQAWKKGMGEKIRASACNRFLAESFGAKSRDFMLKKIVLRENPRGEMQKMYNRSALKKIAAPFAWLAGNKF